MTIFNTSKQKLFLLIALFFSVPAIGQITIEEVVVTAQKREQAMQDVGIAVSAFSGEELSNMGVNVSKDVAAYVPGVSLSQELGGVNATFTIRGINQNDWARHLEAPTAVYVDDGYFANPGSHLITMFDLKRIEFLKGPQGTLYGRNATGGAVNIVTNRPTEDLEAGIDVQYGHEDSVRSEMFLSGPLSETVKGRLAGVYDYNDNWYDNRITDGQSLDGSAEGRGRKEEWAVRGHILFEPNNDFTVLLSGFGGKRTSSEPTYHPKPTVNVLDANGLFINSVNVQPPTTPNFFGLVDPDPGSKNQVISHNFGSDDSTEQETYGATVRVDWTFDNGWELTSVTDYKKYEAFMQLDIDNGEIDALAWTLDPEAENYSQELRLYGETDSTRWNVGIYYLNIDAGTGSLGQILEVFGADAISDNMRMETDSYSAFAQVEYDINSHLTLTGGVRVIQEEKEYDYHSDLYTISPDRSNPLGGTFLFPLRTFTDESDATLVAAKLQLDWHVSEDLLFYAGFNRGVKAGAYNAPFAGAALPADSGIPYNEEILHAYEFGFKSDLMDGRFRLNGSAYYYDYQDHQAFVVDQFINAIVVNADANFYGAELDLTAQLTDRLSLYTGVSLAHQTVKDLEYGGATRDRHPPYSPEFQAVGIIRYEIPFANGTVAFQGEVSANSESYYYMSNFDSTKIDPYTIGNIRVNYTDNSGKWSVYAFGENVWDERYIIAGFDVSGIGGYSEVAYNRPAWWGVGFKYNFF